jgi:DNA-directed RNA polymerase specialized sigma24 family protein
MSTASSVSEWIQQLKTGDPAAAQNLWERYFARLVGFARTKLQPVSRRARDEEDVALSAINSFFRGAQRQRFPQLSDRDDLWQLLLVITERKARDLHEHENRLKRGGGKVRVEALPPGKDDSTADKPGPAVENLPSREPTPAFAVQTAEEFQRLLELLDDGELRSIAMSKMEGYTNEEIAGKMGYVARTIERKLRLIRKIWARAIMP